MFYIGKNNLYSHYIVNMALLLWILARFVYKSQYIEILKMESDGVILAFDVVKSRLFIFVCRYRQVME